MGNLFAPKKRLPTASSMPGTTLGIIPIKAFEDRKTLYDTPGVFLHHRVNSLLTGDQMKELRLGGDLKAYRAPFVDDYEGKDLAISGLGGWIRIVRERNHSKFTNSQGDKGNITVRVWSLPGVEVFVRDCMPL